VGTLYAVYPLSENNKKNFFKEIGWRFCYSTAVAKYEPLEADCENNYI